MCIKNVQSANTIWDEPIKKACGQQIKLDTTHLNVPTYLPRPTYLPKPTYLPTYLSF
jgi:hypothetical protein